MRRRRFLTLTAGAVAVSGCFRPMLAETSDAATLRGTIELPEVDDRFGYFMVRSLEDRLGRTEAAEYRLEVATRVIEQGLAIEQDNSVTRITLLVEADWVLYRLPDRRPVLQSRSVTQSGYDATPDLFATRQTRLDVERRLARDLGERVARGILGRARTVKAQA